MVTIYTWFGYRIPIKERFQLIKQAGFDGVLIWWDDDFDKIDFHTAFYVWHCDTLPKRISSLAKSCNNIKEGQWYI